MGEVVLRSSWDLHGRIALVTGGGRGLGVEIVKGLAAWGAHVLINGRELDALERVVAEVRAFGGTAETLAFDITDEAAVASAFARVGDRLDILLNNVGVRDRRGLFEVCLREAKSRRGRFRIGNEIVEPPPVTQRSS